MFYPNFSRRTLALILSCLVITLGGVGLLFLIYIFNETSSLLSGPLEKISHSNQPYKQSLIKSDEHKFDKKFRNQRTQEFKANINRANLYKNRSTYFPAPSEGGVLSFSTNIIEDNNKIQPIDLSRKEAKTTEASLDTIYIDDFDRSTFNRKSKNDIGSIDYFDVILVDHKVDKNPNTLNNIPNQSIQNKNIIFETISNNKKDIYSKGITTSKENLVYNSTKVSVKAIESGNISDEDKSKLADTESAGSGSGDYTDDTELNEIDTKKEHDNNNNKRKILQNNIIKKQRRWKHPYHLFENYSKSISFLSRLTTESYNNNDVSGFVNRRGSANLTSDQDVSSQFTAELKSDSLQNESDKDVIQANSFKRYDSFNNDSNPSSAAPQYSNFHDNVGISELESTMDGQAVDNSPTKLRENHIGETGVSWIETRTKRIMGNVRKSEERSRQLLLCEEAGGGELCRMLFKEHVND